MYVASTAELLADIAEEMELEPVEAAVLVGQLLEPIDETDEGFSGFSLRATDEANLVRIRGMVDF